MLSKQPYGMEAKDEANILVYVAVPPDISGICLCFESIILPHPQSVQLGSDPEPGKPTKHSTPCHVHEISLRQHWPCDTEKVIIQEVTT